MSFSALRLAEPIVRAVAAKGYTTATDIQAGAIPPAIEGRDVLGTAQTGTGKTCAFALPILHRLAEASKGLPAKHARQDARRRKASVPRSLVLCPTRELATQIHESFVSYGHQLRLKYAVVYGGVSQYHQVRSMRHGVDVLVATPGRLKDLIDQGLIDLSQVETLVLDEADRMLDMGFVHDIRQIVGMMPESRQTLLFSATISDTIRRLAADLMSDPEIVETAPESTTVELVDQRIYMIDQHRKTQLLTHLLSAEKVQRALVFTRTKFGADKVVRRLKQSGIAADAIHSNKTQAARNSTMRNFKEGRVRVLVATDIASRGIDVNDITHVVNYDMPIDPETYVHRIGRTARAGASGMAITFCCSDQRRLLRGIERRSNITLPPAEEIPTMVTPPREERIQDERKARSGGKPEGFKPWKRDGERSDRSERPQREGGQKPSRKKQFERPTRKGGFKKPFDHKGGKPGGFKAWKRDGERSDRSERPQREGGYKPSRKKQFERPTREGGFKKTFNQNGPKAGGGGYKPKWVKDGDRDGRPQRKGSAKPAWRKSSDRPAREGGYKPAWKKQGERSDRPAGDRDVKQSDFKKSGFKKSGFKKPGFKKAGFRKAGAKKSGAAKQAGFKKNGGYPRASSERGNGQSGGPRDQARRAGKSRVSNSNRRGSSKRYA